jgi:hypothetical protein
LYNLTKSDEVKRHEAYVAEKFGVSPHDTSKRDAVELVAARTRETMKELTKLEGRKYYC